MSLRSNGKLVVKVYATPFDNLLADAAAPVALPGYDLAPLAPPEVSMALVARSAPANHWLLATPQAKHLALSNPWDQAHAAARASGYTHYVEPDIVHERPAVATAPAAAVAPGQLVGPMDKNWAPCPPPDVAVSPGWHLQQGFADFLAVRDQATGAGVRIAHLDTGYTPGHDSTPRGLKPGLGWDYVTGVPNAIDPGTKGFLDNPGHGTATLALLAGATLNLTYQGVSFQGDFGGAPDADVIPVRISPSVIHIETSTMYQGLMHALAPLGQVAERAHVVTISHGGLPTNAWADAVNQLYDAGVVVVAASGDSIYLVLADVATHFTVYPSAFNRVVTALGATYAKAPYITSTAGELQGCWGPDIVMEKAIAAYTPNVAWMRYDVLPAGFDMSGAGTSSSTPQIAAAAALWLQQNMAALPASWVRVEACRLALFDSASNSQPNKSELGWGLLNVPALLAPETAARAIAAAQSGAAAPEDSVSFAFWRLLLGFGPPASEQDRMYETEVAQVVTSSANPQLQAAARLAGSVQPPVDKAHALALLKAEPISRSLRARLP